MNNNKPLTNLVYDQIYRDVIDGTYMANDILTESQLMQRYGVSKSPVREALITLCDERVLQSIPRAGYQVVQVMPDEIEQIVQARQALELYMLEKSFDKIGEAEIASLREWNDRINQEEALQAPINKQWYDNMGFHLLLASFAGNAYMSKILENTMRISARATTQYFVNITGKMLQQKRGTHDQLIQALEMKDHETAKQLLIDDTKHLLSWWSLK